MTRMYKTGLVIGKFYPPHLGHKFLIDTAQEKSEKVYVLVCDDKRQKIPAQLRRDWIAQIHPDAIVKVIPEIYNDDDSVLWAKHTIDFLGFAPDCVFTSEDYGHAYAKYMKCHHIQVDKERKNIHISATMVRSDPQKYLSFLHPIVREYFVPRVVVLGAESTGTTTLAKKLGEQYKTNWVPEFGRTFSEGLGDIWNYKWPHDDFVYIADTQNKLENYLTHSANKVLICDTDSFATTLWEERYAGEISSEVKSLVQYSDKKLYILTGDEIPFVQDGIRDGEHIRHNMHKRFISVLNENKLNWVLVEGSVEKRLELATKKIDEFILQRNNF